MEVRQVIDQLQQTAVGADRNVAARMKKEIKAMSKALKKDIEIRLNNIEAAMDDFEDAANRKPFRQGLNKLITSYNKIQAILKEMAGGK